MIERDSKESELSSGYMPLSLFKGAVIILYAGYRILRARDWTSRIDRTIKRNGCCIVDAVVAKP